MKKRRVVFFLAAVLLAAALFSLWDAAMFYKDRDRAAVFAFSRTCVENSRDILLALESAYRRRYARNLTLSRLSEAVILPLAPDKGAALRYDASMSASVCLEDDLKMLLRMRDLLE